MSAFPVLSIQWLVFYSITRTVMGKGINEQYSGNADMAGERPPKLSVFNF